MVGKRPTIQGVTAEARAVLKRSGYALRLTSSKWLGQWSKPRHGGPDFRVARVDFEAPDGRRVMRLVTVERDADGRCSSWDMR